MICTFRTLRYVIAWSRRKKAHADWIERKIKKTKTKSFTFEITWSFPRRKPGRRNNSWRRLLHNQCRLRLSQPDFLRGRMFSVTTRRHFSSPNFHPEKSHPQERGTFCRTNRTVDLFLFRARFSPSSRGRSASAASRRRTRKEPRCGVEILRRHRSVKCPRH